MDENEGRNPAAGRVAPNKGISHLTQPEKVLIIQMMEDGGNYTQIARKLGRQRLTVQRFHRRWREHGTLERASGQGRKRKTTEREDRLIINLIKRDRFITSTEIQAHPSLQHVSKRLISERIKESGIFNSYWAARKPLLSKANIKKRLEWALAHRHWTKEDWRRVLWTDESPFVLRFRGKKRVWRMHNERFKSECLLPSVKHDKKINVWGCFCASGVGRLHLIKGIMDTNIYLSIMEEPMLHSADLLFGRENWHFQQDNDPKHTSKASKEWFLDQEVPLMDWPSQSPDLNPIENLWSILDRKCAERKCNSEAALFAVLKRTWESLPKTLLEDLIDSMPDRIEAVIQNKGGHTKY